MLASKRLSSFLHVCICTSFGILWLLYGYCTDPYKDVVIRILILVLCLI